MERPIAVAFELDAEGKLRPSETVARYGGVYSFVPLGETRSGAKFAIQGDFLVQPGRDAINYEPQWNEWLLDEIVTMCKQEVVPEFKRHPKWKYQILRAFEFTKSLGSESYDRLFGPRLVQPLEQFINQDQCVPTRDGCWVRPKNAAVTDENEEALKGLVSLEILSEGEIAPVFGADADLKFAHPSVQNRMGAPLKSVSRRQLFENADYLQNQAKSTDGPKWFRALYLWLSRCPKMESYRPYRAHYDRQRPKRYDNCEIVLTADNSLHFGREVLVPNLKSGDPVLLEASKTLHERKPVLHPDILSGSDAEVEKLKGFLTGLTGAQFLDAQTICRDALLPKIVTSQTPPPLPDELIKLTRVCRRELEAGTPLGNELWVLTKHREVKPARHVLLSREYKPMEDWETNSCYVSGLFFLSADYIDSDPNDDTLRGWREFFLKGGVKQTPDGGVEEFAVNFAKEKTREENLTVLSVEKRNYGYDLTMATESGENIQVEVKGLSGDKDIDLTRNETDAAGLLGDKFFLCIVTGIPNNPSMHAVRDPIKVGKSEKLTVHLADWKSRGDKLI